MCTAADVASIGNQVYWLLTTNSNAIAVSRTQQFTMALGLLIRVCPHPSLARASTVNVPFQVVPELCPFNHYILRKNQSLLNLSITIKKVVSSQLNAVKSKSTSFMLRSTTGRPVFLMSDTDLGPVSNFALFTNYLCRELRACWRGAPSLKRGRVCNLHCSQSLVKVAQDPWSYFAVSLILTQVYS
jgi:hypothetical protein